jgi:hypothetical protein
MNLVSSGSSRRISTRALRGALAVTVLWIGSAALRDNANEAIPDRLSDEAFWSLSNELSEPAGFFRSDNLVGNEVTLQHPVPELIKRTPRNGVYLGVGPDQNFVYIAAIRPKIAFIVDIRRLNVLQHLFYKSLFELSPERADFLSMLFARPRPPGLDAESTPADLIAAYRTAVPDSALFARSLLRIRNHLTKTHKFELTDDDFAGIEYVYTAFFADGPDLTYNFGSGRGRYGGGRYMPSYGHLIAESDASGVPRGYLATEETYRFLRGLQERNLIVPVTGDFAGPRALRAVGDWVRKRGATITAFYTSNVEQYLFQSEMNWRNFFENVGSFPVDSSSTFIRAIFNSGYQFSGPSPGPRSITLLCPIDRHVREFRESRLQSYYDVMGCPGP